MSTANIFEVASRRKFRYPYKGMTTTEDLWDLALAQLDTIYKALNKDVKVAQEESLLTKMTDTDVELLTKIEIVKYIFNVKEAEAEARKTANANAAKKQRILEVIAQKEDSALQDMSKEDLLKMLDDLG